MPTARSILVLCAALAAGAPCAALAHPHVWVTTRAEIAYENGRLVGVRHAWTFDPAYSAFVTQGLDADKDGVLSPGELQGLARENTSNLAEFGYFTKLKIAGREQAFGEPQEPGMRWEGDRLTLSFLLPVKAPVPQGRGVAALEIYDPTYFVAFSLDEGTEAARLVGAPTGCAASLTRAKSAEIKTAEAGRPMTEAFFEALTASATYGAQFANRVIVACP